MKMEKKIQVIPIIFICCTSFLCFGMTGQSDPNEYINISVEEAWVLLSNTTNGVHIPIDVRTTTEWNGERIDTPFPEFPRHFELSKIQNNEDYQDFVSIYNGSDVVMYCRSGGRSASAASIFIDRGFNGTVYNVEGGITTWKLNGFPIKQGNDNPQKPMLPTGPETILLNTPTTFSSSTNDENDDIVHIGWDWNFDDNIDTWSDYMLSSTVIQQEHVFYTPGTYQVRAIAEDHVGGTSDFTDPIIVIAHSAPTITSFEGPNEGNTRKTYEYIVSGTDPDNHTISYQITWGDDTEDLIGPYPSGTETSINHTWQNKGSYTIQVKTIDEYDAESDVFTHAVSIPKTRTILSLLQQIDEFITWIYEMITQ